MLTAVGDGSDATPAAETLASWPADALGDALARVAFWSIVSNATTRHALREHPDRYEQRRWFFTTAVAADAGRSLSLDDVEHHQRGSLT